MRTLRLVRRDVLVGLRAFSPVAISLSLTIALYLLVAGPAYDRLIGVVAVGGVHLGYLEFLSVGIMAIAALESSFITGSMFWLDRRLGMFAQLLAGPYTRDQYVASKLLSSILLATAFSAAAVIVAVCAAPDPRVAEALGRAMLAVPLAALAFSSLGMLAASYVRSNEAFNVLINAVLLPS
ncbi:hypothetical protein B6U99_03240 [Candidatus Geothermarchaeota archaeon ex4572_27]|nr:MAG: hypothetical protein B6U99_03240 [Candidatus Geothermarchaeota archaeon ex4572_27]